MAPQRKRSRTEDSVETTPPKSRVLPSTRGPRTGLDLPGSTDDSQASQKQASNSTIDSIDLSGLEDDESLESTVQKQLEDAVASQKYPERPDGTKLSNLTCTVCMENMTEITATTCGHVYCRACLINWLKSAEKEPETKPNCPACRKPIRRAEKNQILTLEIMTKPRLKGYRSAVAG